MKLQPRVTHHWRQRVLQRLGPDVDPEALFRRIAESIVADDEGFARWKANLVNGTKLYRIEVDGAGVFGAVVSEEPNCLLAVTLLPAHASIKRSPKAPPRMLCGFRDARKSKWRKRRD